MRLAGSRYRMARAKSCPITRPSMYSLPAPTTATGGCSRQEAGQALTDRQQQTLSLTQDVRGVEVPELLGGEAVERGGPGQVLVRAQPVLQAVPGVEEAVAVGLHGGRPLEVREGLAQVLLHRVTHEVRVAQTVQGPDKQRQREVKRPVTPPSATSIGLT